MEAGKLAPEWRTEFWLNAGEPVSLASLRGRPVFAIAFQMLCPGCVAQALPQAARVRAAFAGTDLAVVALHTVFEHHAAQGTRAALEAFCHEYRIAFPVGLDAPHPAGGPSLTMRDYAMRGTPTLLLFDRAGRLRQQRFGHVEDLWLGAVLQGLIAEPPATHPDAGQATACNEGVCNIPPTGA